MLGLILIIGGLTLFFLGNIKPDIKRDSDNIYAVVAILAGVFSVINFTKGFVESLEQLLLVGSLVTLMWQNIQSRTPNPDAKRSGFMGGGRDDDRPKRPYRAERVNEYEEFGAAPRGGAGLESGRRGGYGSDSGYDDRSLPRRDSWDDDRPRNPNRGGGGNSIDGGGRGGRSSARDEELRRIAGRPGERDDSPRGRENRDGRSGPGADRDGAGRDDSDRGNFDRGNRDLGNIPSGPDSDRPRRRRDTESPRRRRRVEQVEDINTAPEEIADADYVDYTPIESDTSSTNSSWGPKG
jgi:hypothetical protein